MHVTFESEPVGCTLGRSHMQRDLEELCFGVEVGVEAERVSLHVDNIAKVAPCSVPKNRSIIFSLVLKLCALWSQIISVAEFLGAMDGIL